MTREREDAIKIIEFIMRYMTLETSERNALKMAIKALEQEPKIGQCKDCKYFEYDSVAEVHGIPLIVAHEICKRWGDGCQSREDGYCFLFEPKMREVEE